MKIFYLNCAAGLNNKDKREWLINYICENDIDVICLAEASNYNLIEDFLNKFSKENCWIAKDKYVDLWETGDIKTNNLANDGRKMNIYSKEEVKYNPLDYSISHELFDDNYNKMLNDYGKGTIISMKHDNFEVVAVHIQNPKDKPAKTKPANPLNIYYELGLRKLYKHMNEHKPLIVFGDFNNYEDCVSFEKFKKLNSNYTSVNKDKKAKSYIYKYKNEFYESLLDHTFVINDKIDKVKMEYVSTFKYGLEEGGFNHKGMLITIE